MPVAKDPQEIFTSITRKIFSPIYLLHGEEPYYIDLISDFIEENILEEFDREFNLTMLYGRDTNLMDILDRSKRYPMMANYQVIIVKEAQDIRNLFKKGGGDDNEPAGTNESNADKQFKNYCLNPLSSTILVICFKYKKIDKRLSILKTIEKSGTVYESGKIYDNQVPAWITKYLKQKGFQISSDTAELLASHLGTNLSTVVNELSKLTINLTENTLISNDLVEKNIGISKEFNIFEFLKALGEKNIYKTNFIVKYFIANPKEFPLLMILPNMFTYFQKVLKMHYMGSKSDQEIAGEIGVNPWFVSEYRAAARNYPVNKLVRIFGYLRVCNTKAIGIDNENTAQGELLRELIFKTLH